MNGILVYNKFLNTSKFNDIYDRLQKSAMKFGITLDAVSNAEIIAEPCNTGIAAKRFDSSSTKDPYENRIDTIQFEETFKEKNTVESTNNTFSKIPSQIHANVRIQSLLEKCDFILFWDKDIVLAQALEAAGYRLFNSADAIACCDDKALTYARLRSVVEMPKTLHIPMTFSGIGYTDFEFLDEIVNVLGYPYVIKECSGSFGAQVYLATTRDEAQSILSQIGGKPCIVQEYIHACEGISALNPSSGAYLGSNLGDNHASKSCNSENQRFGSDIRIQTVGNRIVAAMHRFNLNDFRANITNGGSMEPYEVTEEDRKIALKVAQVLNLDFAGIDIIHNTDGKPMLLEVNSNAHFKNIYECTGVNVADCIMEYISTCSFS